ncbi:MAG: hypothetical protein RR220_07960, partial [Bacteroidaceae bacterium]
NGEIREFPEHRGCFGIVHHEGLSCYRLESDTVEEAIEEIRESCKDGSGFGYATVGEVRLLKTISAKEMESLRDLHILDVEDIVSEC